MRPVCLALLAALLAGPGPAQHDFSSEPLLASTISEQNIEMSGRYVRQWREPDGTWLLVFNGGFRLTMGERHLSANSAVVWVESRQNETDQRTFHLLTVYLCENAEVHEPGGTITVDNVLLVRGLRTYGQIIKYDDAHAPEDVTESPLYQQALRDRLAIEGGTRPGEVTAPEVARIEDLRVTTERPPRVVGYELGRIEPAVTADGERVIVATGGVKFWQFGGPDAPLLTIKADNAVVFPTEETASALLGGQAEREEEQPPREKQEGQPETEEPKRPERPPGERGREGEPNPEEGAGVMGLGGMQAQGQVRSVYLEGDVAMWLGSRFVRANRLYYDFERDRALILDAVFRVEIPQREVPLYVRAAEVRQLSAREIEATDAVVTTSEFHTPSYHVGAERIYVRDLTRRDAEGDPVGPLKGEYEMHDSALYVGGVPIAWWPYSRGPLEESETLLRRLRTGYSGDFGYELETGWYLFNLLGIGPPEGYDATLWLDYLSHRGPGVGIDADYEREDHYGFLRSYYIHDDGEDNLGPARRREEQPSTTERGRVLWRHRHYLPYDWEVTLEAAYASDPYFLEEYDKAEWFESKTQETVVYLKRAGDVDAVSLLGNWRTLDFITQTEHLPELAYRRIGDTFLGPVVLYHESRVGGVRYRPDERHDVYRRLVGMPKASDTTFRLDMREEAELPLKLGALNVVPFASIRGTYWDGQPHGAGGLWRGLGVYGVRGSAIFSRVFDQVESELLDIHRIRHIVQPEFAAWWGHSNTRSELLTPYDFGIETIDGFYGFMAGLRQTWQTRRGPPDLRRTVDLLTLNLELGVFGDVEDRDEMSNGYVNPLRPENSRTRNYVAGDLIYRLSDSTSLLYDFNIDLNDFSFDRHNVALAVERSPRLAYVFGTRFAGDIDLSVIGGGWNYKLSEKHITTVRGWWDIDTGRLGELSLGYVRKLPRWYMALNFDYANVDDDFTVSVSLWPEGIPEWTIGSRRFTGLATSTGIRP